MPRRTGLRRRRGARDDHRHGRGFDPDRPTGLRHGIRDSIVARMEAVGAGRPWPRAPAGGRGSSWSGAVPGTSRSSADPSWTRSCSPSPWGTSSPSSSGCSSHPGRALRRPRSRRHSRPRTRRAWRARSS
ncbi:hypothetical protein HMPREF1550_01666 [Actinomyces sp. oral taxon 877 str. F0543]|nr:hypothetical protein HMPREF1550_01666 [Actinomyces sp. oral taxon 877 str. F0543]